MRNLATIIVLILASSGCGENHYSVQNRTALDQLQRRLEATEDRGSDYDLIYAKPMLIRGINFLQSHPSETPIECVPIGGYLDDHTGHRHLIIWLLSSNHIEHELRLLDSNNNSIRLQIDGINATAGDPNSAFVMLAYCLISSYEDPICQVPQVLVPSQFDIDDDIWVECKKSHHRALIHGGGLLRKLFRDQENGNQGQ